MNLAKYTSKNIAIAILGSHSALDVCRGAKSLGFKTLVICEKGREKTYANYFKTNGKTGCVDEVLLLGKFAELLDPQIQKNLQKQHAIFVPHRSFEVYLKFDYAAIENSFDIPMFGNRRLLKIEERGDGYTQYDLLKDAGIAYPKQFDNPHEIDRLCLVKVLEKARGFERAFFLVNNYKDYKKQIEEKLAQDIFTKEQLKNAVIEEYVVGVQVNFNFFYSPITKKLELLGTDTRRQTNFEGIGRIPGKFQEQVISHFPISYEEAGHSAVTVLESLLEPAFAIGEKFVNVCQKKFAPGIIGPFSLQTIITAGPPKKEIIVIDVSPRMPGSPGISATPYSGYLYGESISVGKRLAMEFKNALRAKKLGTILT